jgi:acetylornithine deacetylase/succinyl-diaminopimelate desuccinylase-like protein
MNETAAPEEGREASAGEHVGVSGSAGERVGVPRSAVARVLHALDVEELAELAVELGAIESPAGSEGAAAEAVERWWRSEGVPTRRIALDERRPAVVATIEGSGSGPTLLFNAHLDTAISRHDSLVYLEPDALRYISAWREGNQLFGNGLVNDKAPMAAFMIAAAAIRRSGVSLRGDLRLVSAPGEIGLEPMDEFTGVEYLGKDLGTRFTVTHGAVGDAALVAEATGNAIAWVMAGKAYFKISVLGGEPLYTPFVPPERELLAHPNSIVRAAAAITAINEWIADYGERRFESAGGTVVPRAVIGAIRSGYPYKITKSTQVTHLYLDVRLLPGVLPTEVQREMAEALRAAEVDFRIECMMYRRGHEASRIEPLASAVRDSHRAEFGEDPPPPPAPATSMWRDINPYNEAGIPSLTYGPSTSTGGGNFAMSLDDLAGSARVYARTMLAFCGVA